jgi:hypothetical protein
MEAERTTEGVERRCPLCAPARAKGLGASPVVLNEEKLQFFGIGSEWLGWPLCGTHLHEYEVSTERTEGKEGGVAEEPERKRRRKAEKRHNIKAPLDHVPLQPIGLFESCFLERHGTPRQGLLVPSSRGKLTLRR